MTTPLTDREKRVAEIREAVNDIVTIRTVDEWRRMIRFLLSELDLAEKELELFDQRGETIERQLNIIEQLQEENQKRFVQIAELVSERERLIKENQKLRDKLSEIKECYAAMESMWFKEQQKIEQLERAKEALQNDYLTLYADFEKLIEGLLQVYEECRDIECRKLVADILTSAGVNPDE